LEGGSGLVGLSRAEGDGGPAFALGLVVPGGGGGGDRVVVAVRVVVEAAAGVHELELGVGEEAVDRVGGEVVGGGAHRDRAGEDDLIKIVDLEAGVLKAGADGGRGDVGERGGDLAGDVGVVGAGGGLGAPEVDGAQGVAGPGHLDQGGGAGAGAAEHLREFFINCADKILCAGHAPPPLSVALFVGCSLGCYVEFRG
jgi:hypothetical protein